MRWRSLRITPRPRCPCWAWLLSDDTALDDRIIKTADKQAQLLAVLKDPDIPLHNNDVERAIYWFMV
jgi:hypothetical protein